MRIGRIEQPHDVVEHFIPRVDVVERGSERPVHVDRRAQGVTGVDHLEEIERLDRLRESPPCLLLRRGHVEQHRVVERIQQVVGGADVRVAGDPQVPAEAGATGVERAEQQLGLEPVVAGIEDVGFSPEDPQLGHVAVELGDVRARADEQPLRRRRDLGAGRVRRQVVDARVVQVRHVRVAACTGERQPEHQREIRERRDLPGPRREERNGLGADDHGQNPALTVNQKLRLRG